MLTITLAAFAGTAVVPPDKNSKPYPYREVLGPRARPGQRAPFQHLQQVVFTHDGSRMAAGAGATIFVWSVADGKELVRMCEPTTHR
jgi:hypothetical protein